MKFTRNAHAQWNGTIKNGSGQLSTDSKVLSQTPYSYKTRFDNEKGTNPEELIAAAHAGCFTMQLSGLLSEAGFTPSALSTDAKLTFENGSVASIVLSLDADVPDISNEKLENLAYQAKEICPISKLLNTEIQLKINNLTPA